MIEPHDLRRRTHVLSDSKDGSSVWFLVVGLTSLYLTLVFFGGGFAHAATTGMTRVNIVSCMVLLWGAHIAGQHSGISWRRRLRSPWIISYALVFVGMAAQAAFAMIAGKIDLDLPTLSDLIKQILVYGAPLVLIPVGGTILQSTVFRRAIVMHAVIGAALIVKTISAHDLVTRSDYTTGEMEISMAHGSVLYAVIPALLFLPIAKPPVIALTFMTAIAYSAYALSFQSRISSVLLVLAFGLAVLVKRRLARDLKWWRTVYLLFSMCILSLIVSILIGQSLGRFQESYEAFRLRWVQGASANITGNPITEDIRYHEVSLLADQMSSWDWLAGRGLLARWDGSDMYNGEMRAMVHVGYMNYVFMGGIPLLILMCVAPVLALRRNAKVASPYVLIGSCYVIIRIIELSAYGVPHLIPSWFVECIFVGGAMEQGLDGRKPRAQ
jgi:hypothetical protein